jgi:neutral ceramidase
MLKLAVSVVAFCCLVIDVAPAHAEGFRAGAATSNITPDLGIDIVGNFAPSYAVNVHDELHARCLVVDDGTTKLAFVVCDLLGMHRQVSIEARQLIKEAVGIEPDNVMISATHTHSAGNALGVSRLAKDQPLNDYQKFVARRIADGVRRANHVLRPAQVGFGRVEAPEHVFNRRWVMKDGTAPVNPFGKIDKVKMNPPHGHPGLVEPAGPVDPTVSIIAFREPEGRLISVFSAYSLHYVGGVPSNEISADYYAVFCETLKKLQPEPDPVKGIPFVALLANGTSGDINNRNYAVPAVNKPAYEQMNYVGQDLAKKVNDAIAGFTWKDTAKLSARTRDLEMERKPISDELIAWAKETKAKEGRIKGGVDLAQIYATRVLGLVEVQGTKTSVILQYLKIGDIGIGTFPTETFAETGLEFKKRSPLPNSFMVEIAHGYQGYLPTPRHFELGGYETWPGTNQLEPQASVKMLDALLELGAE